MNRVLDDVFLLFFSCCDNHNNNKTMKIKMRKLKNEKKNTRHFTGPISLLLVLDLHVDALVNGLGQLRDLNLKALLHLVEHLDVVVVGHKGNGQTLGAEATCTSYTVQVRVRVFRHVVVDDNVDALNVHAAAKDVGGAQNALLKLLERLVALEAIGFEGGGGRGRRSEVRNVFTSPPQFSPILLRHAAVNANGGECLLDKQTAQGLAAAHVLQEDDDLVEFQSIQQVQQLLVLLLLGQVAVKLLEAVQRQLGIVVDIDLHGLRGGGDGKAKGRGEQF